MTWELHTKRSGIVRGNAEPLVCFAKDGITFNAAASDLWLKGVPFVEFFIDREAGKLAIGFRSEATQNTYRVGQNGNARIRKITCKSLIKALALAHLPFRATPLLNEQTRLLEITVP